MNAPTLPAELPQPLVPAEVDLRDFATMPLAVQMLRDSRFVSEVKPEAFRAGVLLWCAAWRAVRALGYRKLITYTLATEPGASLRASGFRVVGEVRGRSWSCPSRPRVDTAPHQDKLRWEMAA